MIIENLPYRIKLEDAQGYTLNSSDNTCLYDIEYFHENTNGSNKCSPTSQHGIRVFQNNKEIKSAIVCATGGGTGIHEDCALIANDLIFICCCDSIYCLEMPKLELKWKKRFDFATCFGIYRFKEDLLIHGELQISRIDFQGNKKWIFSAQDIFVSLDGSESFSIQNDKIYLKDWEGIEYLLNENGEN